MRKDFSSQNYKYFLIDRVNGFRLETLIEWDELDGNKHTEIYQLRVFDLELPLDTWYRPIKEELATCEVEALDKRQAWLDYFKRAREGGGTDEPTKRE